MAAGAVAGTGPETNKEVVGARTAVETRIVTADDVVGVAQQEHRW